MAPEQDARDDKRLEELFQREKRTILWTSGWLSVLSLAWTGHTIFAHIVHKRIAEMRVIDPIDYLPELEGYVLMTKPWLDASRVLVISLASGFISCLLRWLLVIRKRRKPDGAE